MGSQGEAQDLGERAPRPKAHRGGGQVCPSRTLSRLLSRKRESSRTHRSTSSRHPPPLLGASRGFLQAPGSFLHVHCWIQAIKRLISWIQKAVDEGKPRKCLEKPPEHDPVTQNQALPGGYPRSGSQRSFSRSGGYLQEHQSI